MGWKYYLAVILGNITGILIHRSIRWYFENKRSHNGNKKELRKDQNK